MFATGLREKLVVTPHWLFGIFSEEQDDATLGQLPATGQGIVFRVFKVPEIPLMQ